MEVTNGSYEHVFEWDDSTEVTCSLTEGDYLIVSSKTRPAVAAGPVRIVAFKQLTIHLERYLKSCILEFFKNHSRLWFKKATFYMTWVHSLNGYSSVLFIPIQFYWKFVAFVLYNSLHRSFLTPYFQNLLPHFCFVNIKCYLEFLKVYLVFQKKP